MLVALALSTWIGCTADAGPPAAPQAPPAQFNPNLSLAPLAESVEPAVVNVYVTQRQRVPAGYQIMYGWPSEQVTQGQGSGFVISPDGFILTNSHVVTGASEIRVKFSSGEEIPARLVGADPSSDVALLRIDAGRTLNYLQLGDSDALRVGDWVMAVGNPLGLGHTVTAGILSAKGREIEDLAALPEFLQTDASINPGNSGGPLVALDGTVVGMNTAIVSGANSVAFAIPSTYIQDVLPQLRETGRVAHGWLGVSSAPLNARGLAQYGVKHGVVVTEVQPQSPADKAGILPGDVVLKVGGRDVTDSRSVWKAVASREPGETITIDALRDGKEQALQVVLASRPASPERRPGR
jgi:serine protease Do